MEMRPLVQQPIAGETASLEYIVLQSENERLRREKDYLKALLEASKEEVKELKKTIENLKSEKNQLSEKLAQLMYEQEHLKNTYLQQLQRDGRVCAGDCILCVIVWICRHKLDADLRNSYCGRLLENIIILEGAKNITKEDLKCGKFMRMLKKCDIVTDIKLVYHKEKKLKEAWDALRRNSERVCILATMKADGAGHALVAEAMTRDGKIPIYDPQSGQSVAASQRFFEQYVIDEGLTALTLFPVNLAKLGQIVNKNKDILHYTANLHESQHLPAADTPLDVSYIKWR